MFYQLVAIDARVLPAPMVIETTEYRVADGGLLLEPPGATPYGFAEGHGIIRFFGRPEGEALKYLGSSSESYRWPAPGILDFSRPDSPDGANFSGRVTLDQLELVAEGGASFVRAGTRLSLLASPESPIPAGWEDTFNFGPPVIQPVDPALCDDPVVMTAIDDAILAAEPRRKRAATLRLQTAWRALA